MRPIQFLIFVIFILASSTQASAVDINVRIVNETGITIQPRSVDVNDKRGTTEYGSCYGSSSHGAFYHVVLSPNDDVRCELDGREKKQRSLEVSFTCDEMHNTRHDRQDRIVVFPRERGWFGRKHLKNNNDIYTLKNKESDC